MGDRSHVAALLLLAALIAGLYTRTLDDPFHFDDLGEMTSTVRAVAPHVSTDHYRGIVTLWLWALDFRFGGDDPAIYHATNVALHFGATACLYWLAWLVMPPVPARRPVAFGAAAVFAVHPLATQSVAYVTQRSTSAAAFLFLLAVAAWLAARRTEGWRSGALWLLALLAHATGLYTKHVVLMVPLVLLLGERLLHLPAAPRRRLVLLLLPFVLLSAVRAAQYLPRLTRTAPRFQAVDAARTEPLIARGTYALSQPRSIAKYVQLFAWPAGQNLDADPTPVRSPASPSAWAPALALATLAAFAIARRRTDPVLTFGVGVFFLALLPTSSVIRSPDLFFEHRAYLPMAGLCLALVPALAAAARRPVPAGIGLAVLIAVLSAVTIRRLAVWDSDLALWEDTVRKSPGKARPRVNYGLALQSAGRLDDAEAQYRRALQLRPDYPFALNNLGNVVRRLGRPGEARGLMERALEIRPGYVSPRLNLGNLAMDAGDPVTAEHWYREALERAPTAAEAHYNLAKALEAQGRLFEAIDEYAAATSGQPRHPMFANDLGCARLHAGDPVGAESELRRAIALRPDWEVPWYNLGLALNAASRPDEARAAFEEALKRNPALEPARTGLESLSR